MRVNLKSEKTINRIAARTPEVEAVLGDLAFEVTQRARVLLAEHGGDHHKITQTKGDVDHYVNLDGPAAVAIEHGHHLSVNRTTTRDGMTVHWHGKTGKWVEGLHILGRAIGGG